MLLFSKKNYSVQGVISKTLALSLISVFIVASITAIFLAHKSYEIEQINSRKKIHELMAALLTPSLALSDTAEIRRLLSLISNKDEIYTVINDDSNILLNDYTQENIVKLVMGQEKVFGGCNHMQGKKLYFNNVKYNVYCSEIYLGDIESRVNKVDRSIGYLLSFSAQHNIIFDNHLFFYLIFVAIITLVLSMLLVRTIFRKRILHPITALKDKITLKRINNEYINPDLGDIENVPVDIMEIKQAFESLLINLQTETRKRNESERKSVLYDFAVQVAHDIGSPLAALEILVQSSSVTMPEDSRILIRNIASRIRNISNSLLVKFRHSVESVENDDLVPHHLYSLINNCIDEKRIQYKDFPLIQISIKSDEGAYSLFSILKADDFNRMLSNIINNAFESLDGRGVISVILEDKNDNYSHLIIQDNGKGIPDDILQQLGSYRITYGKQEGSGLGVYHAKKTIENLGGKFLIDSKLNIGTSIRILLPKSQIPEWFIPKIILKKNFNVVIIDDDQFIHSVWQKRFMPFLNISKNDLNLYHFYSPDEFSLWRNNNNFDEDTIYLCDYEFVGSDENGIDLVTRYGINHLSVIVTSRMNFEDILLTCNSKGIRLLQKSMAVAIPINIVK